MKRENFEGDVQVFKSKYYINLDKNINIDRVLKDMEKCMFIISKKIRVPDLLLEDQMQELRILALEGIRKFNPEKGTSLSTFLWLHMKNKLIEKVTNKHLKKKNASYLSQAKTNSKYNHSISEASSIITVEGVELCFSDLTSGDEAIVSMCRNRFQSPEDMETKIYISQVQEGMSEEDANFFFKLAYDSKQASEAIRDLEFSDYTGYSKIEKFKKNKKIKQLIN